MSDDLGFCALELVRRCRDRAVLRIELDAQRGMSFTRRGEVGFHAVQGRVFAGEGFVRAAELRVAVEVTGEAVAQVVEVRLRPRGVVARREESGVGFDRAGNVLVAALPGVSEAALRGEAPVVDEPAALEALDLGSVVLDVGIEVPVVRGGLHVPNDNDFYLRGPLTRTVE